MASGGSHVDFALTVASWLAGQHSHHTRDAYRRDLERYVEWWSAARDGSPLDTTTDDLDAYRESVSGDLAAATTARRLASMGSFFAHAASQGVIPEAPRAPDPPASSPPRRTPRSLTTTEIDQLTDAAARLGGRHHVLFALLLFDKQRLRDILEYDVADVHLGPRRVVLSDSSGATWQADSRTASALRPHVAGRTAGPLLESHSSGRRLSRFGADFLLRQISEHAAVRPAVSANALRRATADATS